MKQASSKWSAARLATRAALLLCTLLAACSSHFETPQLLGRAALVNDAGRPRLWVMTRQEESRQVGVGSGGRTNSRRWRVDTYFHFDVTAFDPVAATPLWTQRLLTIGDPDARGKTTSFVIGSDVDARLLGQDGELVWLLIGEAPYALRATDGSIVVTAESLQQLNPSLKGVLPSEARFYGFDRGLVLTTADARQLVIRGAEHKAEPYAPPPALAVPQELKANGMPEIVPTVPYGEVPARHVTLRGQRLGLYTEKEAADAANDGWGRKLRWPYTVTNEGRLARRTFWTATVETTQRFDERFEHIAAHTPVSESPVFLNGRFAKDPASGNARVLDDPEGVLVWHSTRLDDAGRLALARLDAALQTRWRTELPLSESSTSNPLSIWWLPTHVVVVGTQQIEENGATKHVPHLVSIELASGDMRSVQIAK